MPLFETKFSDETFEDPDKRQWVFCWNVFMSPCFWLVHWLPWLLLWVDEWGLRFLMEIECRNPDQRLPWHYEPSRFLLFGFFLSLFQCLVRRWKNAWTKTLRTSSFFFFFWKYLTSFARVPGSHFRRRPSL